jgi:hypothetical protein
LVVVPLGALLVVEPGWADTLHVPSEYPKIQAAVDAASDGDSLVIAPGTYQESVEITKKDLAIVAAGADLTYIDSPFVGVSIFYSDVQITGVDIRTNGSAVTGIQADYSHLTVNNSRIHDSDGGGGGGGAIYSFRPFSLDFTDVAFLRNTGIAGAVSVIEGGTVRFTRCLFQDNQMTRHVNGGGAMTVEALTVDIIDCDFLHNTTLPGRPSLAGAIFFAHPEGHMTVDRCLFARNQATDCGAVLAEYGTATFRNCTFADNIGTMVSALYFYSITATVERCIMSSSVAIPAIGCDGTTSVAVTCSNVWTPDPSFCGGGKGNFSLDPLFCGMDRWDLQVGSPCAPAANPSCGLIGARDVGCVTPVGAATWGQIKSRMLHKE